MRLTTVSWNRTLCAAHFVLAADAVERVRDRGTTPRCALTFSRVAPWRSSATAPSDCAGVLAYIPELLPDVLEGRINPGSVLGFETDLDGVGEAYAAMDERRAIKSLLRVGSL
jgi:hypothetical protein